MVYVQNVCIYLTILWIIGEHVRHNILEVGLTDSETEKNPSVVHKKGLQMPVGIS